MHIAFAQKAFPGEIECGDAFTVVEGESTIIALADGLGHGPLAAEAATAFCDYTREHASESLREILHGASSSLAHTQGAAAALVRIDTKEGKLSFAGIGNIELRSESQQPMRPVSIAGIVGRPIRKVMEFEYEISRGDLVAIYTDGISGLFDLDKYNGDEAKRIADSILSEHARQWDDATCVVIRY